jgi:hypothetical protein
LRSRRARIESLKRSSDYRAASQLEAGRCTTVIRAAECVRQVALIRDQWEPRVDDVQVSVEDFMCADCASLDTSPEADWKVRDTGAPAASTAAPQQIQ